MAPTFVLLTNPRSFGPRAGVLHTVHGDVPTPCFMAIGTVGAVKHIAPAELRGAGARMILANTYHLMLRPGTEYLAARGGLHRFMGWDGPILTDSGGFQVFSLGARARKHGGDSLVQLSDAGVRFRSHLDGTTHLLTPEIALEHQRRIGSDIAMVLDVCPPHPCSTRALREALTLTSLWARRSVAHADHVGFRERGHLLFGIVQGGSDPQLRAEQAAAIAALPFDGVAIGGVAVGEEKALIRQTVACTTPLLPVDRPRYLMGLGTPDDIVHAVQHGVDLFDCVLPTRDARHGRAYRWVDRQAFPSGKWYERITVTGAAMRVMDAPLDPACHCLACTTVTTAYLRHLLHIGEPLGQRLLTLHNLAFYFDFLRGIRERALRLEARD